MPRSQVDPRRFASLFEPRGIVVAGVSSHPGKFGFVALHNILASGFRGPVFGTNREGGEVLGLPMLASVDELPDDTVDLVFVCTPASANPELLRACAAKGIRAAFVTSAGYSEAGDEGRRAESDLVGLADDLGILLAGPNGQGVVSTPVHLCAQIVAPYPPPGGIAIASQSGNFVSSFQNYATATGVGVSRAVSAGNAAALTVPDFLEYYAADPATRVSLAYVEGISDGRDFYERARACAAAKPLVLLKGGTTGGGQRAAASHTGALASDERVFDGMCRQAGITRASTVEEAFEAAATFATQPLPEGPRVAVVTTAGGWGVANHASIDAVIYLGLGIQSNQARLMRAGRFFPEYGLDRIVAYHERQDARFAHAAAAISERTGKPILTATELAVADRDNAGPQAVRESGRVCYASSNRAVTALEHLWRYARYRQRRG